MNWLQYSLKHWASIKIRYGVIQNSNPAKSWSQIQTNFPYLRGSKLYLPDGLWKDAGYIDLKTHFVVENEGVSDMGRNRLDRLFEELCHIIPSSE
jgi:hypothetical protein